MKKSEHSRSILLPLTPPFVPVLDMYSPHIFSTNKLCIWPKLWRAENASGMIFILRKCKIWTFLSGMARSLGGWNSDSDFEDADHQQGVPSLLLLIHLTFVLLFGLISAGRR